MLRNVATPLSAAANCTCVTLDMTQQTGPVLAEFDGETEDELSVAPGEELVVLSEVEGWLQVLSSRVHAFTPGPL